MELSPLCTVSTTYTPQPASVGEEASDLKKVRRSERIRSLDDEPSTPLKKGGALPSPMTHQDSIITQNLDFRNGTVTPPDDRVANSQLRSPRSGGHKKLSQYTQELTQAFSQFLPPLKSYEVDDEEGQGVWGYLVPVDDDPKSEVLVLKQRSACPVPDMKEKHEKSKVSKHTYQNQEKKFEKEKIKGMASSGYLIGRHQECGRQPSTPQVFQA